MCGFLKSPLLFSERGFRGEVDLRRDAQKRVRCIRPHPRRIQGAEMCGTMWFVHPLRSEGRGAGGDGGSREGSTLDESERVMAP